MRSLPIDTARHGTTWHQDLTYATKWSFSVANPSIANPHLGSCGSHYAQPKAPEGCYAQGNEDSHSPLGLGVTQVGRLVPFQARARAAFGP